MNKEQLQNLLNQKYDAANWNKIYGSIFPNVMLFASPKEIAVTENWVKSFKQRGLVRLQGNQDVAIFEVVLQDGISVQSKRVGLRNLVAKLIDEYQNHGVLAVFDNGSTEYRFTFAAKETKVTREGIEKTETDSKRYTYILGETETCKTAAEQFIKLSEKGSTISLSDLQEAFSVEKLSKQFFNEYKEQYTYFISYLESQPKILKSVFADDEKRMRDFVKLLLGRLVFLQFVQKKRWLGVPSKNTDWSSGDVKFLVNTYKAFSKKEKYYSEFLEELFFECLNSPNRKNELFSITGTKVPFLNGGLFENDNPKTKSINFPTSYFDGLFDFFGRYNFTIDENDPTEKEVGIDPEMLGSIFENLLEDNKDKGAFYTPKEIVHYMCQESLIEYLCTKINTQNDEKVTTSIRNLITKRKIDGDGTELIKPIATALREVKICDPAIGSGAFPMGMLMEIFHCVFELYNADSKIVSKEWNLNGWQANVVKSNIIQNSIYGVDIEKGAVDIARLRFWLSLVVDEEEPKALPNLDYKIVVGNSLVSKLGDDIIDIDWEVKANTEAAKKLQQEIQNNLNKLLKTQKLFFDFNGKKENLKEEIRNLKIDVLISQLQLDKYKYGNNSAQIGSLFEMTAKERATSEDRENKLLGFEKTIRELQKLKSKTDQPLNFFDWKLDFPEVLNELINSNAGFDIVIANPPYVGVKGNQKIFDAIKQSNLSKFLKGRSELFYFFIHQAIILGKKDCVNTFITTNYYITASDANVLRKSLKEETTIVKLLNFNEMKLFPSAQGQHNMITIFKKGLSKDSIVKSFITKYKGFPKDNVLPFIFDFSDSNTNYFTTTHSEVFEGANHYMRIEGKSGSSESLKGVYKAINCKQTLGDICFVRQGLRTGIDKITDSHIAKFNYTGKKGEGVFILTETELKEKGISKKDKLIRPLFKNSDVSKYVTGEINNKYLIYTDNSITLSKLKNNHKAIYDHLKKYKDLIIQIRNQNNEDTSTWFLLDRPREEWIFEGDKIVAPQRSKTNTFGFNSISWYSSADVYYIKTKMKEYDLKYILSLLNSRLFLIWLLYKGKRKGEMLELYQQPLSEIPIKEVSKEIQSKLSSFAAKIILLKSQDRDTTDLEKQIDNIVYKIYELTYDEVKEIDSEFKLSKKEYDKIELE